MTDEAHGTALAELSHPYNLGSFLADRSGQIALACTCTLALFAILRVLALGLDGALVCCFLVASCFTLLFAIDYLRKRRFYREIAEASASLEHAYQLASVVSNPDFLEGRLLLDVCSEVCRADSADLHAEQLRNAANKRFFDLWAHEVKTPVAAARLTLTRMHGPEAAALKLDLERIERAVERALCSARLASVSQDYSIRQVNLAGLCRETCRSMSNLLIGSGTMPSFAVPEDLAVLADPFWVGFVLRQALSNSAKYGATSVSFSAWEENPNTPQGRTTLELRDDGEGIPAEDMPRVFDQGFSGENGHQEGSSTGMGLYLASEVCRTMGLSLSLASERGKGTRMLIAFPADQTNVTEA